MKSARIRAAIAVCTLLLPILLHADAITADVVIVVDTSTSMANLGMDPERTSLLVAKLFADIVPGDLAVVRLLDLSKDARWLPSRGTGKEVTCSDDPSKKCEHVEPTSDWDADVRTNRYGALVRPARGDAAFKQQLDAHLRQNINNSLFGLSFRAAQGVFESRPASTATRSVIWLSDGASDDPGRMQAVLGDLQNLGVVVEPIVFGRGATTLQKQLGLISVPVRSPGDLMKAFAGAFRRIMKAPYELDNLVGAHPSFEMKPRVDEAWVVVYGDDTLADVTIDSPQGPLRADYAQDRLQGAGTYRVLHVLGPAAGKWTVRASGGGAGAAYAVVQRSNVVPILIEPRTAVAGVPVAVVAGVGAKQSGPVLTSAELPDSVGMDVTFGGQTYRLHDDGADGDAVARDGRFTGMVTLEEIGEMVVNIRVKSPLLDHSTRETIKVIGSFHYHGGPIEVDFGSLRAGSEVCESFSLIPSDHQGRMQFDIRSLRSLPSGHTLEIRTPRKTGSAGSKPIDVGPGETLHICLVTARRAPSSNTTGEPALELAAVGGSPSDAAVRLHLRWQVQALTWWELWGKLLMGILALLVIMAWLYGYVVPIRFQRNLTLVFVPDRDELDEQTPQPLAQWKGVGIGWYRSAHAYLHASFRVSGNSRGAVASLHAIRSGTQVRPASGNSLYRENIDGDWEPVAISGRRAGSGEAFRVGDSGPFFKISMRRG